MRGWAALQAPLPRSCVVAAVADSSRSNPQGPPQDVSAAGIQVTSKLCSSEGVTGGLKAQFHPSFVRTNRARSETSFLLNPGGPRVRDGHQARTS